MNKPGHAAPRPNLKSQIVTSSLPIPALIAGMRGIDWG
jgi:hypothetical protein